MTGNKLNMCNMSLLFRYIIPYNTYQSINKLISLNKKPSSAMAV